MTEQKDIDNIKSAIYFLAENIAYQLARENQENGKAKGYPPEMFETDVKSFVAQVKQMLNH